MAVLVSALILGSSLIASETVEQLNPVMRAMSRMVRCPLASGASTGVGVGDVPVRSAPARKSCDSSTCSCLVYCFPFGRLRPRKFQEGGKFVFSLPKFGLTIRFLRRRQS